MHKELLAPFIKKKKKPNNNDGINTNYNNSHCCTSTKTQYIYICCTKISDTPNICKYLQIVYLGFFVISNIISQYYFRVLELSQWILEDFLKNKKYLKNSWMKPYNIPVIMSSNNHLLHVLFFYITFTSI